jgi:hypothetical protein
LIILEKTGGKENEEKINDRNFQIILRSGGAIRCLALQPGNRAIAFIPAAIFGGQKTSGCLEYDAPL